MGPIAMAVKLAADHTGMNPEHITGPSQRRIHARARQCVMYAAHQAGKSLTLIGSVLGKRDHTTVLHGVRTVKSALEKGEPWANLAVELESRIKSHSLVFLKDGTGREWLE